MTRFKTRFGFFILVFLALGAAFQLGTRSAKADGPVVYVEWITDHAGSSNQRLTDADNGIVCYRPSSRLGKPEHNWNCVKK